LPRLKEPDRVTAERLAQAEFGHYWLINPTASRREKAWPVEKFRELSRRLVPLLAGAGLELRILGAPSESEWLRQAVPPGLDPGRAIVQPPSARHLLDVLGGARALVTNTSSTQFLAPGLGVRTLTLMGRSRPEIWGPLGPRDLVVRGAIDPALDKEIFRQEELAYQSIPVASVLAACEEMLR
jgi:ADP-heptose:LPS heptosyltransferase